MKPGGPRLVQLGIDGADELLVLGCPLGLDLVADNGVLHSRSPVNYRLGFSASVSCEPELRVAQRTPSPSSAGTASSPGAGTARPSRPILSCGGAGRPSSAE